MRYKVEIVLEVEIEAPNVARAHAEAKKIRGFGSAYTSTGKRKVVATRRGLPRRIDPTV